jgi:hypothetical protein
VYTGGVGYPLPAPHVGGFSRIDSGEGGSAVICSETSVTFVGGHKMLR